MKRFTKSIQWVASRPYVTMGGAIIRSIRPVPIDVAHVVASACRHGGAEGSFQF